MHKTLPLSTLVLVLYLPTLVNADVVMSCSWVVHNGEIYKDFISPPGCMSNKRLSEAVGFGPASFTKIIAASTPPDCPAGYKQYKSVIGEYYQSDTGGTYIIKRICLKK